MAHAWNACWVHALGGSNPPSSAEHEAPGPVRSRGFVVSGTVVPRHGIAAVEMQ